MKPKVFLPLLEQICMIGFFALAASLCLQGFALANRISNDRYIKDCAVVAAQNTAEILKNTKGDLEAAANILSGKSDISSLTILYDSHGEPTFSEDDEEFRLCASILQSNDCLFGSSTIQIIYEEKVIYELTVGWQEDSDYAK